MTGAFSAWEAGARFIWVGAGGVVVGFLAGRAGIWLYERLTDSRAQIIISFVTAFGSYSIGEHVGVSGVIATVTAGLVFGRWIPERATAQIRVEAQACWDVAIFVVNGFVFTLIGLQLPSVIYHLSYDWRQLCVWAAALTLVVIAVRFLWIFPATYIPRLISASLQKRDPAPPWRSIFVLSWTGMRGIVTLAAALALPKTFSNGQDFPHRELIVFLAYTVILSTLLIPALTLPFILRRLGIHAGDEHVREEALARVRSARAVLDGLSALAEEPLYSSAQVAQVAERYRRRVRTLESNLSSQAYSALVDEDQQLRRLLRHVLTLERSALIALRSTGEIHDEVFHLVSRELDFEELRLRTQRF
jgi:monovalent cation/hydrogen antiporter